MLSKKFWNQKRKDDQYFKIKIGQTIDHTTD